MYMERGIGGFLIHLYSVRAQRGEGCEYSRDLADMLDLPGMVIPLESRVDPALDPVDASFTPASARDAEIQATCASQRQSNAF